jgi:hypothetical protein
LNHTVCDDGGWGDEEAEEPWTLGGGRRDWFGRSSGCRYFGTYGFDLIHQRKVSDGSDQKTEIRDQKTEIRDQKTEIKGLTLHPPFWISDFSSLFSASVYGASGRM